MKDLREYDFFKKLAELPFVDAIYVYGSHAHGSADERSDVNLAVLCPDANETDWNKVRRVVEEADMLVKVEAVRWDRIPPNTTLRARINLERVPLFIRESRSHASMMSDIFTLMQWHLKVFADAAAKEFPTPQERRATLVEHFRKTTRYFWRLCRHALIVYGVRTYSPLSTFKSAVMEGWLPDREFWEQLYHDWQHLIPQGTPEALEQIEQRLPDYMKALEQAAGTIQKAVNDAQTH